MEGDEAIEWQIRVAQRRVGERFTVCDVHTLAGAVQFGQRFLAFG